MLEAVGTDAVSSGYPRADVHDALCGSTLAGLPYAGWWSSRPLGPRATGRGRWPRRAIRA